MRNLWPFVSYPISRESVRWLGCFSYCAGASSPRLLARALRPVKIGLVDEVPAQTQLELTLSRLSPNAVDSKAGLAVLEPSVRSPEADPADAASRCGVQREVGPECGAILAESDGPERRGEALPRASRSGRVGERSCLRQERSNSPCDRSPTSATPDGVGWQDAHRPGVSAKEHADPFYVHNTIRTLEDGDIRAMRSIDGTIRQVWYQTWCEDDRWWSLLSLAPPESPSRSGTPWP
jgi:hypothetical protein